MPSKIDPNDWNTFFSADGPRHRGPLGVLIQSIIVLAVAGGLVYGLYAFNQRLDTQNIAREQTIIALAPTRTAEAFRNSQQQTAEAAPTALPNLPTGRVLATVPLRSDPNETAPARGNLNPNDSVQFIESRDVAGQVWWNVRLAERANTAVEGATVGATGWVAASNLTEPSAPAQNPNNASVQLPLINLSGANLNLYRDANTNISVSRDPRWNPQNLPTLANSLFLAPALDSGEGVIAAKIVGKQQDQAGFQAAVNDVANVLAKPGTTPTLNGSNEGTITFTRTVGGQDVTMQGRFSAKAAPGNSIGVVIAFVPDNSFGANDAVLSQIVQGVIFQ